MIGLRRDAAFSPVLVVTSGGYRNPVVADQLLTGDGVAPCPAAPLLAATLCRRGVACARGLLSFDDRCGDQRALGFTVSWVDGRGRRVGLGAAASADDPHAVETTARVVREWSAVLRPRRIVLLREPAPVDLLLALDPATAGEGVRMLSAPGDLRPEWLAGAGTVGLLTHPDTRRRLLTGVVNVINGLGPATVVNPDLLPALVERAA
ncbi:hypothetical protein JOF53_008110 [Crossiella equi]|uniref:Uncharacterized protein n=1 Tax=Crossiella equi TaxID=130796 RepID=A0ABS5ARP5_9PSEU|nr:hypothetical protein [Crossiella equi]MBP2479238.1 hypothetical protein [Crossiella equi]